MGFSINTRQVSRVTSFANAERVFNNRGPVRSTRWSNNERPLKNTQAAHMFIRQGEWNDLPYYECVLYRTPLVRYFKPAADGSYAVWLQGHNSQSSWSFLSHMGWWNRKEIVTDDKDLSKIKLLISISKNVAHTLTGNEFTVRLVFNADNTLDLTRSVCITATKYRTSELQKERRKQMRKQLEMVMDIVDLRYSSMLPELIVDVDKGRPFAEADFDRDYYVLKTQAETLLPQWVDSPDMTEEVMETVVQYAVSIAQATAQQQMNKHAYDVDNYRDIKQHQKLFEQDPEVIAAITPKQETIRKSVLERLVTSAGLGQQDQSVSLPMFSANPPQNASMWTELSRVTPEDCHKLNARKDTVYGYDT